MKLRKISAEIGGAHKTPGIDFDELPKPIPGAGESGPEHCRL